MAMQVTKVNLPDRTRARFEAENNQQRVQKPHDIRSSIPLVDYTNPAKFPPYIFREYPKMPLLDNNRPIVIDESGGVLIFYDATDEVDFKDMNPELAEEIERNTPTKALADAIAAQQNEIDDLRARLRAAGIDEPKKLTKNAVAAAARAPVQSSLTPNAPQPEPGGLREALPKTGERPGKGNPLKKN